MALRLGFLKVIYSRWVRMTTPTLILEEELIQYYYNLILFFSNLSKIIPSQKYLGDFINISEIFWENVTHDDIKSA